jgi:hypothetical protein
MNVIVYKNDPSWWKRRLSQPVPKKFSPFHFGEILPIEGGRITDIAFTKSTREAIRAVGQ